MPFDWFSEVSILKGVGPKTSEKLAKLGIQTWGDLLLHCPSRYEDRTQLTKIAQVTLEKWVVVQGEISQIKIEGKHKKRALITIEDDTAALNLLFFNFHPSQFKNFKVHAKLRCFGQVTVSNHQWQMIHPECDAALMPLPQSLTPIYPSVAGLSQSFMRRQIQSLLQQMPVQPTDCFAQKLTTLVSMPSLAQALSTIHYPLPSDDIEALHQRTHLAYQRLIYEELLTHQISLVRLKNEAQLKKRMPFDFKQDIIQQFLQDLPFELTAAQKRVWQEIKKDLLRTMPMMRLIQGDVGCGKTVVAALAALMSITNKYQVALMAPTEILAEQHHIQFKTWFDKLGFRCELLTSKLSKKAKCNILENITLGLTDLVIGTHALFQEDVLFKELGLVIIDEQHRFGVHQRLALGKKGEEALEPSYPHQLVMTATPIPRTLIMSQYAHLDLSIIDSKPSHRLPIITRVIPQSRRNEVIEKIKAVCANHQQVYWVCTLVEASEVLQCQAATETLALLQTTLPFTVALVHGQMDADEKEQVMQAFYQGDIAVLVATTVIEVGVNVPNATLMVIENPERLGLAQMHQLRGRVGRGNKESYCILLYKAPLSAIAKSRLELMRETQDGFVIAQADLNLRGPGEILGSRQTGALEFKIACLKRDEALLPHLHTWANFLMNELSEIEIAHMMRRWKIQASNEIVA
ncbi:MAG: ATP-dependent DNA helicase RecG [Proteobacteria bacterium]|nr:ATP-dependent DNA helicase RecG [Pseudomonadota bacterium]